jgi:hypothetical protein
MSMIDVNLYDVVRLKDGRNGTVVDIYTTPPLPTGYEVDITDNEMELVIVTIDQIEEVEWKSPYTTNW